MARGFKTPNNYTPGSRNPLARTIRSTGFRTRIVKSKKGKGSYKRKGRFQDRPFSFPYSSGALPVGMWLLYDLRGDQ